jgi:hypothetical protein
MKKLVSIAGLVLIVVLIVLSLYSLPNGEAIAGQGYSSLTNDQKQAFWDCWKNDCKILLENSRVVKNYSKYRECSLGCFAKAEELKGDWCEDTDKGIDYFTKGTVTSNIYANGKEDYCHNASNGKTYLFEQRCKNNKYKQPIQKKCEELGEGYKCVEGTCLEVCKIYQGPGTFNLSVCDKVVYDNYEFEVLGLTSNNNYKKVTFKIKKQILNKGTLEYDYYVLTEDYGTISSYHPFFTEFGANILANKVNLEDNYAEISFYEDCNEIYNYCKDFSKISEFPLDSCDWVCSFDYKISERNYYENSNFILSLPQGYSQIADLILNNAQNCFEKMVPLLNISPYKKVSIIYDEKSYPGCSGGYFFEKVICQISTDYNDINLIPQTEFNELLEEKECLSYFNTPFSSAPHEITHNLAVGHLRSLNGFLVEGIAEYVEHNISIGIPNDVICTTDGYYFSLLPSELHEYQPLDENSHYEGLCFIRDIKEKYGEEKLKKLFSYSEQQKNGCYFLFADIINPVVEDNAFLLFKEKYKISEDPYNCIKGYFS